MAGVRGDEPIPLEEANAIAAMMVATGRVLPPQKFIDSWIDAAEEAALNSLF